MKGQAMKPKKHPYSGFRKTDNKQDRVKFAEVLNYEQINVSIVVREGENSEILAKCVIRAYGEALSFIATLPVKGIRFSKQNQALFKIRLYQRIEKMGSEKLLESNRFIWSNMCLEEFNKIVI
ncbi:hypothetical protein DXN33_02305 [Streptococcus sp. NM]|uniref:hypothetical protein n=1 Tax=Streptococcus sp. NM TaxID=2292266 RepID=UPI000E228DF2|nr:hypothetical protein [Streptococcus sp. NM]REK93590.1 hypothetical protein DXN33_02305 [Streptococcus sp. NM]